MQEGCLKIFCAPDHGLTWVNPHSQGSVSDLLILLCGNGPVLSVPVGKTPGQPQEKNPGQLGRWLRDELEKRGYDLSRGQSAFAREVGVVPSIINRILNEDRTAEIDILRRIGRPLGYSVVEMLIFAGLIERGEATVRSSEQLQVVSDNPYRDPQERAIWEIDGIDDELKHIMIRFMRTMRERDRKADEAPSTVTELRRPS